ncbi:MAG TPA: DoxX family protein [Anaeromyxobacteraceae bacterium]|nr:DoxX family protein [Anaeromyxobacteraceae bacterium]
MQHTSTTAEGAMIGARSAASPAGKRMLWIGRILSALPVLMLAMSASMKLARLAPVTESWHEQFGYPDGALLPIAVVEASCAIIYAIPRTAVLGAVLVTGYLGGAVATHVRIGDPAFVAPLILGVVAWAGLYLRDARVRSLLPLRPQ